MSRSSEAVKKWRQRTKSRMVEAMGGKCQCCGYNICDKALAFHHLDPSVKESGIGSIRANPISWAKLVEELRKCILVCHNCHSEIHAGVRNLPTEYSLFDESFADYNSVIHEKDNCSSCGTIKSAALKFCSNKCAATNRRKVDWDNIDLLELMKVNTVSALEDMLGISNAAIYKRRDKLLKQIIP